MWWCGGAVVCALKLVVWWWYGGVVWWCGMVVWWCGVVVWWCGDGCGGGALKLHATLGHGDSLGKGRDVRCLSWSPCWACLCAVFLQVFGIIRSVFGASNARLVNVLSTWTFACLNDGSGCGVLYTNNLLTYVPDSSVAPSWQITAMSPSAGCPCAHCLLVSSAQAQKES